MSAAEHLLRTTVAIGCLAVSFLAGCSSSEAMYNIQGTITFGTAPVTEGTVTFEETAEMKTFQATLTPEGKYGLRVPSGNYKVFVEPPMVAETGVSDAGVTYKAVKNIPQKFRASHSTSLTATVDADSTLNFDLKQ